MPGTDPGDPRVMSGEAWEEFCETLRRAGRLVLADGVPDSPRDRAEGFRYLTRLLAAGIVTCVAHADGDDPSFARMVDYDMRWGLDCPDCLYLYAGVHGDATYRIHGNRGTARHIDIQVNFGHFAEGDISRWGTISSMSGLELRAEPDGSFELLLGGEQREGNWLPLAPNASFVLIRQYFYDWERERPADIYIERFSATPSVPPTTDQVAAQLALLSMWIEKSGALWEQMNKNALALPANSLTVFRSQDSDDRAGLRGQAYGIGNFRCAPDEAVIVEFKPPPCQYWSLGLANWYWESLDFASHQTSLNGHQAALDSDGVLLAVIAHEDPGVANWLDTTGHTQGTLAARFLLASDVPEPKTRVVKLADLASELPGSAHIDAAARSEALERRRRAVMRRYRQ